MAFLPGGLRVPGVLAFGTTAIPGDLRETDLVAFGTTALNGENRPLGGTAGGNGNELVRENPKLVRQSP